MRSVDVSAWMDENGLCDPEDRRELLELVQGLDVHARREVKPSG